MFILQTFTSIFGVGPATADKWFRLGLKTIEDLKKEENLPHKGERILTGVCVFVCVCVCVCVIQIQHLETNTSILSCHSVWANLYFGFKHQHSKYFERLFYWWQWRFQNLGVKWWQVVVNCHHTIFIVFKMPLSSGIIFCVITLWNVQLKVFLSNWDRVAKKGELNLNCHPLASVNGNTLQTHVWSVVFYWNLNCQVRVPSIHWHKLWSVFNKAFSYICHATIWI